jgi:hypothetical protein
MIDDNLVIDDDNFMDDNFMDDDIIVDDGNNLMIQLCVTQNLTVVFSVFTTRSQLDCDQKTNTVCSTMI